MILIDSNILVYAINTSSPKNTVSRRYISTYTHELCITHQNIFETLRILTHPKFDNKHDTIKAIAAISTIADHVQLLTPQNQTPYIALELIRRYTITSNAIYDAYLVATILSNGVGTIATDNEKDFKRFSEITVINPFNN